jgi:hypothetical protein
MSWRWRGRAKLEQECLCPALGGFILGTTKPILPDVPTDNAVACFEAVVGQGERVAAE